MKTYILKLPAAEIVRLLRAETKAAHGAPELHTAAEKEYIIEEDFDRRAYGIHDGEEFDLATAIATLTIEPRVEAGYWILETVIERALGPVRTSEEDELTRKELTLDEFEAELGAPGRKRVFVRLSVQTAAVRKDFDRWLDEMHARHPQPAQPAHIKETARSEDTTKAAGTDRAREVVGVFQNPDALEAAVDALEVSGFDRAAVSVLATGAEARAQIGRFYGTLGALEDSGGATHAAFVSRDSRTEGEAAAVGIPLYVGGFVGAAAVAAAGGALALAIAATVAGAAAGAGIGALLALAIARRHSADVREQLRKGGIVLWVSVADAEAEKRAVAVLEKAGAADIHVHEVKGPWTLGDTPRTVAQADPFLLESDPIPPPR